MKKAAINQVSQTHVKFVNLYWSGETVEVGNVHSSLNAAEVNCKSKGSFICTLKITTSVEPV